MMTVLEMGGTEHNSLEGSKYAQIIQSRHKEAVTHMLSVYTLGSPPSQVASDHQDCFMFSRGFL